MTQELHTIGETSERRRIGKRLEELALALFLVMTGALWLAPSGWIPEGTWLAGAGLILLGLNAARHFYGLGLQGFGIVAGIAALVGGVGRVLGRDFLFIPVLLVAWGAAMIIKSIAMPTKPDNAVN
jgi:hypothetical protein